MKVLFLDVDGVLNNNQFVINYGPNTIDSNLIDLIYIIIYKTGSKIVLSSNWRKSPFSRYMIKKALAEKNLEIMDYTPEIPDKTRSEEIKQWLSENPQVEKFAILDDLDEAGIGLESNFFKTDEEIGITSKIAQNIIEFLGDQYGVF